MNFQRIGGIAGLVAAGTYLFGIGLLLGVLEPAGYDGNDMVAQAKFFSENQLIMYIWNLVIWILNAIVLVILALAIHDKLKEKAPAFSQVATSFALIWAGLVLASGMLSNITLGTVSTLYALNPSQAVIFLQSLTAVESGLGGGNELAGGLWVSILSWGALRTRAFSKAMNICGLLIGLAGLSTLVPALAPITGAIFGLGFIVWFAWVGIHLLRNSDRVVTR
ncbi:hypothetical protein NBRC116601_31810 [Cognatishimia sp. WU-CL00825]|uniref:hypothetical protein n=1 Tax=Cognatishimia sp. WU-CL00825 TaxID=3127658 RepID=UPI003103CF98